MMSLRRPVLAAATVCLTVAASAEEEHDHDHDHGHAHDSETETPYEWAGIFQTPEDTYMWTAQKTQGSSGVGYVDPGMKMVILPATSIDDHGLDELKGEGVHGFEGTCVDVEAGGVITPAEDKCYQLKFRDDLWQSLFTIDARNVQGIAIFAEHFPTEFENTAHYLKDDHGDDIEPVAELPHNEESVDDTGHGDDDKPWGTVLGASFLVNLVTLVGVIFLIPAVKAAQNNYREQFQGLVAGFTAGALMACTFFLLLFEATHMVGVGWKKEVDILWRWGVAILAGFLLPAIIYNLISLIGGDVVHAVDVGQAHDDSEKQCEAENKPEDGLRTRPAEKARLVGGILVGDFFHNLCDGVFIAAAFMGCGSSFGWSVAVGSILHEIPQEFGDFAILTGNGANLNDLVALLLNFLSGLGVMLGAIVTMALDEDQATTGLILAFGGGVYLHIAATECMPRIYNASKLSATVRLQCLLAFIVGAILIGLVLLDHEHCVPSVAEGEVDPHAGHHH